MRFWWVIRNWTYRQAGTGADWATNSKPLKGLRHESAPVVRRFKWGNQRLRVRNLCRNEVDSLTWRAHTLKLVSKAMSTRGTLILAPIGGLVLNLLAFHAFAQDRPERYFDFDRTASTGLIEVSIIGSTTMETIDFTLFGNGRMEMIVRSSGGDRHVIRLMQAQLNEETVSRFAQDAVDSGLAQFDAKATADALRKAGRFVSMPSDGIGVIFKINLEYLAVGAETAISPYSHTVILDNPEVYARTFTEVKEYGSLDRLVRAISDMYFQSSRGENP
jgi:hypothetical protein